MSSPVLHRLNPFTLPLSGLQLIEASAGTGKTFTLAALYVRLVLGQVPAPQLATLGEGLYPPQILVMTFTEAATAELRERIRERLAQAAQYFQTGSAPNVDDFLRDLRAQIAPDAWPQCAYRLDMAAQWMDDAAIFTIHGWCSRMLKSHAFDSASLFEQNRVEDPDRLKLQAVQDYWRRWFYALEVPALAALVKVGDTPQALLKQLKDLWRESERAPTPDSASLESPTDLLARWSVWQAQRVVLESSARLGWTAQVTQALNDAAVAKQIKGVRFDYFAGWLVKMADWAQGAEIDPVTLARFTASTLIGKGWTQAAHWPVLAELDTLHAHLTTEPEVVAGVLAHAAQAVAQTYQRAKAQAAQFDFSDLLQNLYQALQAPDGRLARVIAAQYPVALVDEFQDTDPWQFGSLSKIYSSLRPVDGGLIMIGDPKQAIYSFRGADLATYLQARGAAQGIYTLPGNYRSTVGVVAAVNHIFGSAHEPFGSVPFVPVEACKADILPLQVAGQAQVAMTVWHLPFDKTPRKDEFQRAMAAVFASQMVALLQSGAVQSGDMAVLVRDWREAAAIRHALAQRGVRSVYLSERNSVFASGQALDLWRVLRAVAQPGNSRLLRAALATPTWGLDPQALEVLFIDEAAWESQVEQFMQWQQVWRTQGLLPMLYRLLHDQGLAGRLLQGTGDDGADGERALTNLLHLGELLQAASLQLQGEGALIRYLEDQLRQPQASGDGAQLRLESDANLVQVVTLHKSKGLEYPLVFLPFVSNYRAEDKDSPRPDLDRLSEDIRLLYVALTRAKQALWLGVAQLKGDVDGKSPKVKSALSALLGRQTPGDLWPCLQKWAGEHIAVQTAPQPTDVRYLPVQSAKTHKPALVPQRRISQRWWSASFSALTRGLAQDVRLPHSERDEQLQDAQVDSAALVVPNDGRAASFDLLSVEPAFNDFPAGSRYGTLIHDLLEWQAEHHWPAVQAPVDEAVGKAWQVMLARQSQRLNLRPEHSAMLTGWMQQILKSNLPLATVRKAQAAIQIGAIQAADRWAEMGFTLTVQRLGSAQLDALISQHIWPGQLRSPLQARQLEGMLTGFMDLVLLHQGRYYVLDYKSNRLGSYDPRQLQSAMLDHRYDVQAALYLLALHRLLKARLPDYDYDLHVGGALYLFLRGIDQPGCGLLHLCPPRALIEALDLAFAQSSPGETAL
jgi:exodeoxyribonuclease V beta subunit